MTEDFVELRRLAYNRLDQDWDLVHLDPVDHVRDFARYEDAPLTRALVIELEAVAVDGRTEQELEQWWLYDLRSEFEPRKIGMTYRQWFAHVLDVLAERPPLSP